MKKNNSNIQKTTTLTNKQSQILNTEKQRNQKIKYHKLNYQHTGKERINIILESNYFKCYSTLLTIFALYLDDIKKLTTNQSYDKLFDIISVIIIGLFLVEVILDFLVDEQYGCGLFFWIDIIGIITMILDISSISNKIIYGENLEIQQINFNGLLVMKISKNLKIIRIVRITNLVKIFNHMSRQKKKNDDKNNTDI
jgi:hypothetical protein